MHQKNCESWKKRSCNTHKQLAAEVGRLCCENGANVITRSAAGVTGANQPPAAAPQRPRRPQLQVNAVGKLRFDETLGKNTEIWGISTEKCGKENGGRTEKKSSEMT